MKTKLVSIIVISRKNEDTTGLLADMAAQECLWPTEVISIVGVSPPGKARNEGARKAQGEVLVFMDSDIRLDQHTFLVNLVSVLEQNPAIGACCSSFLLPPEANPFQKRYAAEIAHTETLLEEKIIEVYAIPSTCCAMPRELFIKLGGFHEVMIRGEDSELTERVRNAGYRTVLAPRTWCYHPAPASFRKLARTNLRNGSGVAFVDVFFPRLNFDIHLAGHKYFSSAKTWSQRQSRFFRMIIQSIRERKWLLFSAKLFYACGYFSGRAKYALRKSFGLGPSEHQADKLLSKENIKKILVVQLGGIGDLFLSAPALKALREHYPQATLTMMITARSKMINSYFPYIDEIRMLDMQYGGVVRLNKIWHIISTLYKVRKEKFNLAINLRSISTKTSARKMKALLGFIHPDITAGRDTEGRGYFYDLKIPETDTGQKHELEYYEEMMRALGVSISDRRPHLDVSPASEQRVKEMLGKEGVLEQDILIGLHIGGAPANLWPLENYAQVVEILARESRCHFVLALGQSEKPIADRFLGLVSAKIINFTGKLELGELIALIKRCSLFISNDTGPMNLAAILQVPLVALFGPEEPGHFSPAFISDRAVVLYNQVDCSPCFKKLCASQKCLRAITPAEVVKAAREKLNLAKG